MIHGVGTIVLPEGRTLALLSIGLLAILVGAALLIGFLTPIAGAMAAFGNMVVGVLLLFGSSVNETDEAWHAMDVVAMSIALVLLGPGLFSLDARLFGHREIIIPAGRRLPRS